MENISYIALSYQNALRRQMDVTANNVANMTTPGFKAQEIILTEFIAKPQHATERTSLVLDYGSFRRETAGAMTVTNNDLDLAIMGDGFFTIQTPEGEKYSRAGSFMLNEQGEVITKTGNRVLDDGGNAIVVPEGTTKIKISGDGTVAGNNGPFAQIALRRFENSQQLVEAGDNLYDANGAEPLPATDAVLKQGMIEGSNVQPVLEMNKMIEILRTYQSVQRLMQNDHERIRSAIQKLTKV